MQHSQGLTTIIGGRRYSTATAALIADDCYWDGSNFERHGRNTYMYRTPRGAYFQVVCSMWQGDPRERIDVISQAAAQAFWESTQGEQIPFEEAFPGVAIEEA